MATHDESYEDLRSGHICINKFMFKVVGLPFEFDISKALNTFDARLLFGSGVSRLDGRSSEKFSRPHRYNRNSTWLAPAPLLKIMVTVEPFKGKEALKVYFVTMEDVVKGKIRTRGCPLRAPLPLRKRWSEVANESIEKKKRRWLIRGIWSLFLYLRRSKKEKKEILNKALLESKRAYEKQMEEQQTKDLQLKAAWTWSLVDSNIIIIEYLPLKVPKDVGEEGSTEKATTVLIKTEGGQMIEAMNARPLHVVALESRVAQSSRFGTKIKVSKEKVGTAGITSVNKAKKTPMVERVIARATAIEKEGADYKAEVSRGITNMSIHKAPKGPVFYA
ncbi:hypothetical protein ACLOJK_021145 [Asimina triloba]